VDAVASDSMRVAAVGVDDYEVEAVLADRRVEFDAALSPDGRCVA
jgi:hypothetical protein